MSLCSRIKPRVEKPCSRLNTPKHIDRATDTNCCETQTTTIGPECRGDMYSEVVSADALKHNGCNFADPCDDIHEFACADTVTVAYGVTPSNLYISDPTGSLDDSTALCCKPKDCCERNQTASRFINPVLGIKPDMNIKPDLEKRALKDRVTKSRCGTSCREEVCWTSLCDGRLRDPAGNQIMLNEVPRTGAVQSRNHYSERLAHHQTGFYHGYKDIGAGQIRYYNSISADGPFLNPNFAIRADTKTQLYRDPMGRVSTQHVRTPLAKCSRYLLSDCLDAGSGADMAREITHRDEYMGYYSDQLHKNDYSARGADIAGCVKGPPKDNICIDPTVEQISHARSSREVSVV